MFRSKNMSDVQIINRVRSGKRDAFGILVKRYLSYVHTMAYARVGNHADAEDVTQETFLQAFNSLDSLREPSKFSSWLAGITRNIAGKLLRKQGRETAFDPQNGLDVVAKSPDIAKREMQDLVRRNLAELGDTQREILLLYYFTGMNTREIAKHLDISADAAEKRLQRARQTLGQKLVANIGDTLAPEKSKDEQSKQILCAIGISPGAGLGFGGATTIGGALVMKKATVAVIAIAAIVTGTVVVRQSITDKQQTNIAPVRISEPNDGSVETAVARTTNKNQSSIENQTLPIEPVRMNAVESWEIDLNQGHGIIEGEVRNAISLPIPSIPVHLLNIEMNHHPILAYSVKQRAEVISDESGKFRFSGLDILKGTYILFSYTENEAGWTRVYLAGYAPEHDVVLDLISCGAIRGVVQTVAGDRVEGAIIRPLINVNEEFSNHIFYLMSWAMVSKTDDMGYFSIPYLSKGNWKLCVAASGYATLETEPVRTGTENAVFTLGRGATVAGRVIHAETREPVRGVAVNISKDVINPSVAISSEDGHFSLTGLENGKYTISIRDKMHVLVGLPGNFKVRWSKGPSDLELLVSEGARVSGRVYDAENGRGISNVQVSAMSRNSFPSNATTNSEGFYRLEKLIGECTIDISPVPGYAIYHDRSQRLYKKILLKSGQEFKGLDFALSRGRQIHGVVQDQEGNPVQEAIVNALGENRSCQTSSNGTFDLNIRSESLNVEITAHKKGFAEVSTGPLDLKSDIPDKVVITLVPESTISGEVRDSTGKPIAGVKVMAYLESESQESSIFVRDAKKREATTDSQGRYRIAALEPNKYELRIILPNTYFSIDSPRMIVEVGPGEAVTGADMNLGATSLSISGRVTFNDGKPVMGHHISANKISDSHTQFISTANTNADGYYEIKWLDEEHYKVTVNEIMSYSEGQSRRVRAGATDINFKIDYPEDPRSSYGTIEGRVIHAHTGKPITDFEFALRNDDQPYFNTDIYTSVQDPDGFFSCYAPPGRMSISVHATGFPQTAEWEDIGKLKSGKTISNVEIQLVPSSGVNGRVVNAMGQPVSGAYLYLGPLWEFRSISPAYATAKSDDQGRFKLEGLSQDEHTIYAYHDDYATTSTEFYADPSRETSFEIIMAKGGAIEGNVRFDGEPVPGQNVDVSVDDIGHDVKTDDSGYYIVEDIRPGEVTVSVWLASTDSLDLPKLLQTHETLIENNKVTTLDFDFGDEGCLLEGIVTLNGELARGGIVTFETQSGEEDREHYSSIGRDGRYAIDSASPGKVRMIVMVDVHAGEQGDAEDGMRREIIEMEIPDRSSMSYDIELGGQASISGAISGVGEGMDGAVVILNGEVEIPDLSQETLEKFTRIMSAAVDLDGATEFSLENLAPGTYTVFVFVVENEQDYPEGALTDQAVVVLEDGRNTHVDLTPQ